MKKNRVIKKKKKNKSHKELRKRKSRIIGGRD